MLGFGSENRKDNTLIDSQGKLFGKVNIIDALVLLALLLGGLAFVFLRTGTSAQISEVTAPVEIDMIIRSLSVGDPRVFEVGKETSVVIRNQPAGNLTILKVKTLPHQVTLVVNGSVKTVSDPSDPYGKDFVVTLGGSATVTKDGLVIGRVKAKIGTPVEIEGYKYILKGSIVDVRKQGTP
jgi:Domain of unknown function (DUF4330)